MISKNNLKYIKSLQLKKIRKQEHKFLVEGGKSVLELMDSNFSIAQILVTSDFLSNNKDKFEKSSAEITICTEAELADMGSLSSNHNAIAIASCKENLELLPEANEYLLILDGINDPGNLGTIIRIADWYGINKIIASSHTAELYNPKVIAASMGSFTRVSVFYTDLVPYLSHHKTYVYAARLEGQPIYQTNFSLKGGMILMGSEAHGIAADLYPMVDEFVFIPRIGGAESLNVGVATAIFCDNMRRGTFQ